MSRARFRFLRMLLPSGNWRVSVTSNRLIRALFRKGFSRGLFCGVSFRALFRKGFFLAFFRRGFFRALFRRDFYRALFRGGFFCALFRRGFSRGLFCRGSFRALFCRGSYVHSFVGAFSVCSFAGPFPVRSFAGAFSVRCVAGAFSVRSFKLEFRHIASFEWIDMLDASFLKFFSISARVLDQFWASLRGIQHIRDWINWNWNHQKKRPEAWHRIKSYQKRIIRFNQILLQFFLHNCLENQIPFKHMTNMSMIRIKRSLRYNVIYQPCFIHPSRITARWKRTETPLVSTRVTLVVFSGTTQQPCIAILGLPYRQWLERCCVRPELLLFFSSNRFLKVSVD